MKPHRYRVAVAASTLVMACASHPSPPAVPSPSPARCQAISDSVAAQANTDSLPEGGFQHSVAGPGPLPAGVRKGQRVRIRVLVRPDGTPDLTRLDIQGTDDAGYRRRVERALQHAAYIVARVDGCPVLTRVDVFVTKISE